MQKGYNVAIDNVFTSKSLVEFLTSQNPEIYLQQCIKKDTLKLSLVCNVISLSVYKCTNVILKSTLCHAV